MSGRKGVSGFWQNLTQVGVETSISESEKRNLLLCNKLSLFYSIVTLSVSLIGLRFGANSAVLLGFLLSLVGVATLIISYYKYHKEAQVIFALAPTVILFIVESLQPQLHTFHSWDVSFFFFLNLIIANKLAANFQSSYLNLAVFVLHAMWLGLGISTTLNYQLSVAEALLVVQEFSGQIVGLISISLFFAINQESIATNNQNIATKSNFTKEESVPQVTSEQLEKAVTKRNKLEEKLLSLQEELDAVALENQKLLQREEESKSILDSINNHNLVVEYNLKGETIWMNERTQQLTGISENELEKAHKYSITSLLLRSNHFKQGAYDAFWASIRRGISRKYELQVHLQNNRVWVAATFLPICNSEGKVTRILAVAHDITNVKRQQLQVKEINQTLKEQRKEIEEINNSLEERVKERTEKLEKQNKQLTEYAFINAHLLRAPVCNILGLIDLLKNHEFNQDQLEIIKFLDDSTKELDEMVMKINRSIKKGYYDDPTLTEQVENWNRKHATRAKL